jgi:Zn-finger nucleic acid-binding protein
MDCPRDGSGLATAKYEGFDVDKCATCGGIWLDRGELEAIEAKIEHKHQGDPNAAGPNTATRAAIEVEQLGANPVDCPRCGTKMVARDYGFGAQIIIDACPQDCGVWLDVGELQQIERFYEDSQRDALDVLPLGLWFRLRLADWRAKLS